ncbi:MAG: CHRD domain-containing protein [Betaproteobacteria bacterium]|nr:CHRD domain-containing protein [Betaproteobacteria bacterium]MDH5220648.1 CHRD domain-containing protein [Betaproteobacteria bacterium]MDH5349337.1 CHRD domain-containing protein [Betaproteobacteria bacterium]
MSRTTAGVWAVTAVIALAGCADMQKQMPDWMPGSGAISVSLSGAEEVPPVKTSATGSGSFRVADDGTITGSVTTKDIAGTAAHIHLGAKGRNGPVIVPLAKNGDTYSVPAGRKLTESQMKALKAGELYVNVHSAKHRGGEVRAQLQP